MRRAARRTRARTRPVPWMREEFILAPVIFAADEVIKQRVEMKEELNVPRETIGGVSVRRFHNSGAAFGFGEKNSRFMTVLSVVFASVLTVLFFSPFSEKSTRLMKTGLALMLGGAYSNTYDRIRRGYVVDYVSFKSRSEYMSGIVYNLSDFCIAAGALITVIDAARTDD